MAAVARSTPRRLVSALAYGCLYAAILCQNRAETAIVRDEPEFRFFQLLLSTDGGPFPNEERYRTLTDDSQYADGELAVEVLFGDSALDESTADIDRNDLYPEVLKIIAGKIESKLVYKNGVLTELKSRCDAVVDEKTGDQNPEDVTELWSNICSAIAKKIDVSSVRQPEITDDVSQPEITRETSTHHGLSGLGDVIHQINRDKTTTDQPTTQRYPKTTRKPKTTTKKYPTTQRYPRTTRKPNTPTRTTTTPRYH